MKGNLSLNDKQHRRRIKSVLPGDYSSNVSAVTTSGLDEQNNNFGNDDELNQDKDDPEMMAYRSAGAKSNSAYDTIQAKIKAASEASKKGRKDDDMKQVSTSPFDRTDNKETATTQANTQL